MRKNVFGKKFKRDTNERKSLFKGLLSELVLHNRIQTTEQKAKAIKSEADKLVTKVKKNSQHARGLLRADLIESAVVKMVDEIAPRFANRQGGYTRVIKLGRRFNDDASMAILEWTEMPVRAEKSLEGKDKENNDVVKKEAKVSVIAKKQVKKPTSKTEKKETKSKKEEKHTK